MTAPPDHPRLPDSAHRSRWGVVRGAVVTAAGKPVPGCTVVVYPTTTPAHGVPDRAGRTVEDGTYGLGLPAATYTIRATGQHPSGAPCSGEITGVTVVVGQTVTADITVIPQPHRTSAG